MAKKKVKLEDCLNLVKKGAYKTLIDQVAITEDFPTMHKLIECKDITSDDVTKMVDCIMKFHDETDSEKMKELYVEVLDIVTENPKMESEVAEKVCDFAIKNGYSKSLWNIARHNSLTLKIAKQICEYRKATNEWNMTVTMEFLSGNDKTPDDILFYIVEEEWSQSINRIANANLAIRYKLLKEKLSQSKYGRSFLNN